MRAPSVSISITLLWLWCFDIEYYWREQFCVWAMALTSNTTGFANTAIGSSALRSNTTGFFNTAIGPSAAAI